MHAGLLDVLHDAADQHLSAVADRVDVHFDRVVQEAVEQHRRIVGNLHRFAHVALEIALLVHDLHRAPAQHVAKAAPPADSRSPAPAPAPPRRCARCGWAAASAPSWSSSFWKRSRSSAQSIKSGVVPMIGTPFASRSRASLSGVCPPNCTITPERLLDRDDLEHVLQRQRLEVQPVGSVVVGGDGLRVAVDHDGLEAVFAQRKRRVHAAVVELDALADAVGPAAQHHDFLAAGRPRLALLLVGRIHVGGAGGELRRAGIHALVHRPDIRVPSAWRAPRPGWRSAASPAGGRKIRCA